MKKTNEVDNMENSVSINFHHQSAAQQFYTSKCIVSFKLPSFTSIEVYQGMFLYLHNSLQIADPHYAPQGFECTHQEVSFFTTDLHDDIFDTKEEIDQFLYSKAEQIQSLYKFTDYTCKKEYIIDYTC